jgi:hypothetical protein
MMKTVPVYRINYYTKTRIQIGTVQERRQAERGNNFLGLLKLARKSYAVSPQDAQAIVLGGIKGATEASGSGEISTGLAEAGLKR